MKVSSIFSSMLFLYKWNLIIINFLLMNIHTFLNIQYFGFIRNIKTSRWNHSTPSQQEWDTIKDCDRFVYLFITFLELENFRKILSLKIDIHVFYFCFICRIESWLLEELRSSTMVGYNLHKPWEHSKCRRDVSKDHWWLSPQKRCYR